MNKITFEDLPPVAKGLVAVLASQNPDAYLSGNWQKLDFEYSYSREGSGIIVRIPAVSIGFSFDTDGEFRGIYNYQEG